MHNCVNCDSKNVILIQYNYDHPERYDGWSEIKCIDCKTRVGRWSFKVLQEGECEKRHGGK